MAKTLVRNVYIGVVGSLDRIGYGPSHGNADAVPTEVAAQISNASAWALNAASQAEMLALSSATVGDVVIRTDAAPDAIYLLEALPPSALDNWTLLNPPPEPSIEGVDIATQVELDAAVAAAITTLSAAVQASLDALQAEHDDHVATAHGHPDLATHLAMGLDATD